MRPDDPGSAFDDLIQPGIDLPFDADLESLHGELTAAGQHARRMLYGRTQPTRLFSNQLRAHLLGATIAPAASARGGLWTSATIAPQAADRDRAIGRPASSFEETAPAQPGRWRTRPTLSVAPRTMWALLAIAGMAGVLALGALGGTFGPPLP